MPKVVELAGKRVHTKSQTSDHDIDFGAAEIIIFPGVRYERTVENVSSDPALIRR